MRSRLLILGGTGFVGRHIAEAAVEAGHHVTLFNRGRTNPQLFAGDDVDVVVGDRTEGDYSGLRSSPKGWDACIDVNAYTPRVTREAMDALEGRVGHYTFISTVSVYRAAAAGPVDEDSPVQAAPEDLETLDASTYGPLKVACEEAVRDRFGSSCTIVRPGIVAGPFDPTDRFTYWVRRCAAGGTVVAPARPDQPVQVVHARDQADFVVKVTADGASGVFNTVGPTEPLDLAGLVEACATATGASVEVEWVDEELLAAEQVNLPLHLPSTARIDGLFQVSSARARAAGLVNRSIVETARDTHEWDATRDRSQPLAGVSLERERRLLERWRSGT